MREKNILWSQLELVILDVDGTLYNQQKLRRIIKFDLLRYYIVRPWKMKELLILYQFRREREKRAGYQGSNLDFEQYKWCADKLKIDVDFVRKVIGRWIFEMPNKHLKRCLYPGIIEFLNVLKSNGIPVAVYSDYPSSKKLTNMGISVDYEISSIDADVNSFKPHPKALEVLCSRANIDDYNKCLYIGDRDELDGICARALGIPFLLVTEGNKHMHFYDSLKLEIIEAGPSNLQID